MYKSIEKRTEPGQEVVLWRHPMTSYEKLTYTRNCNLGLW